MNAPEDEGHLKLIIALLILVITSFGLILNITGIYTLCKIAKVCKLFNHMVICLLLFDCWFLITSPFFYLGLQHEYFKCELLAWINVYWGMPCGHMAMFGTITMTLAISHERYLAIKDPLEHNSSFDADIAQKKRLLMYVIPSLIMSIGLNITRFFNFEIIPRVNGTTNSISTKLTELACDPNYLLYNEFLFNAIIIGILPFVLLTVFSCRTFIALRRHNAERSRLLGNDEDIHRRRQQQEVNMAKVMLGLSSVFLVCHFLRMLVNCWVGITRRRYDRCDRQDRTAGWPLDSYGILVNIAVFMVMVNSSIGTLTYCAMNAEFRQHLLYSLKRVCCVCKRLENLIKTRNTPDSI